MLALSLLSRDKIQQIVRFWSSESRQNSTAGQILEQRVVTKFNKELDFGAAKAKKCLHYVKITFFIQMGDIE
ncbi:MAG: hypothetical protein IKQ77_05195 [Prevotella sp.]|nr:hypothetical protein [Prevotella sp.]